MVSNYTLVPSVYTPPETLVQKFHIEIDGEVFYREENNHQRFAVIPVGRECQTIRLVIDKLAEEKTSAKVFRFDLC